MAPPSSKAFTPVSLSAHQASSLESILARSVQIAKCNELDEDWRFVGSVGYLKTFKTRGPDRFSTTSSWASTLEKTARATAWDLRERAIAEIDNLNVTRSRRRPRGYYGELPVTTRTVNDICGIKEPTDFAPPLQSHRTFGLVQSNYRDIVDVHYAANSADFVQQQKILSPTAIDGAVLRTIRATQDSYFGIKWLAENSHAGKRDFCYVEMVGYTINPNGQEIGFGFGGRARVSRAFEFGLACANEAHDAGHPDG
jgi:hypothetical protein